MLIRVCGGAIRFFVGFLDRQGDWKLKRKCIYTGRVTDIVDFGGRAKVAVEAPENPEDNGQVVGVKNVIPGQRINFRLKKQGKGDLTEVLEKSPIEVNEVCPVFGACGGCVYSSVGYKDQLEIKLNMVRRLMADFCDVDRIDASPKTTGYRNKMEYSFGDAVKDGPMTLGLHKRGSRFDVVNADACVLVHEDFNRIVTFTLSFFEKKDVPYFRKMSGEGVLRHLVLRRSEATGEILVTLVTTSGMSGDSDIIREYAGGVCGLALEGSIAGVLHTKNDSVADIVKDEGTTVIFGKDYITEELLGLQFKITPFSFFQTNSKGAEVLYSRAREYALSTQLGDKPVIFDLYSGTGTIAQIMAPVARKVIGVEIVEEAVEAAKVNAGLNGLENCEFIAGDVLKCLDEISDVPDFIILDPPRDGVHPKALQKILEYGVKNILYISCKPTSLARDLEVCLEAGYEIGKMGCVDMFPGTGHVETVVYLSKLKSDEHVKVEVDMSEFETTGSERRKLEKSE